jgi:uncharacterized heparinase superfamily protein
MASPLVLGTAAMEDLRAKLEKLKAEADDCALIAKLATDVKKRAFFDNLALQLKSLARDVEGVIAARARLVAGINKDDAAQGAPSSKTSVHRPCEPPGCQGS